MKRLPGRVLRRASVNGAEVRAPPLAPESRDLETVFREVSVEEVDHAA